MHYYNCPDHCIGEVDATGPVPNDKQEQILVFRCYREWLDFCTGEERRKAISLGLTVVRTACQLHTILRKTMVQLVDDMPQEDARRVVMVAIRETYKLQA